MLRVVVFGGLGNVGREIAKAVWEDEELELYAIVDSRAAGEKTEYPEVVAFRTAAEMDSSRIDVMVDFTVAEAAVSNIHWALDNGVHSVVGTTGISDDEIDKIRNKAGAKANVIIAPNFSLGAILMMNFAERAARVFKQCEIIELHHKGKKDAPSGTAMMTAKRVAKELGDSSRVSLESGEKVKGSRGGEVEGLRIHSVRLDGLMAHQEVIFGSPGETLTIKHDTVDRRCYAPGVIMAVKAIPGMSGLTIGIESLLGL
ncbi:MAG: 4-hydroxy-tetrahydrodipicolinate reductase [Actinomycetota bacterium]|nr:4-hydroxy-tetrahydrodipicolinate reductase [Actinomycetota bacterium]